MGEHVVNSGEIGTYVGTRCGRVPVVPLDALRPKGHHADPCPPDPLLPIGPHRAGRRRRPRAPGRLLRHRIGRLDRRGALRWSLPKGHVETGETVEDTAVREVAEETGITGRVVAPLFFPARGPATCCPDAFLAFF